MNLGITPVNYGMKNNNPNFGMAVKFDKKALPIVKEQALSLSQKHVAGEQTAYKSFWNKLNDIIAGQKDNPNNIIIRKTKMRNGLTAEVVDASAENAVKNSKFSQGLFNRKGNLEFLERAEAQANKLQDVNTSIKEFDIANKLDYSAKAKAKAEAKLLAKQVEEVKMEI